MRQALLLAIAFRDLLAAIWLSIGRYDRLIRGSRGIPFGFRAERLQRGEEGVRFELTEPGLGPSANCLTQ